MVRRFSFVVGLCGTAPHNVLKDVTGYCVASSGQLFIQGKPYASPYRDLQRGDTLGLFYNWRGKEILFTRNDAIVFTVGVAKGTPRAHFTPSVPHRVLGRRVHSEDRLGREHEAGILVWAQLRV